MLFDKEKRKLLVYPWARKDAYTILEEVAEIGECAFAGCEALTDISIPVGASRLGEGAFYGVPCIVYQGSAQSEDNWGAKSGIKRVPSFRDGVATWAMPAVFTTADWTAMIPVATVPLTVMLFLIRDNQKDSPVCRE